jgi:elongation factor 1-alpha
MHHKSQEMAAAGDNVGLNIKGLDKTNMPRNGDVMTLKKDMSLIPLSKKNSFVCVVSVLDHPGQLRVGYTPIAYIRTATCACRITAINWKIGKSTGGAKVENPEYIETGVGAEVVFQPQSPFIAEPFNVCAGLGRVAIFEGNSVVMLGKVVAVNK